MKNNVSRYHDCLKYIKDYWKSVTVYNPRDKQLHLGLPNKYVAPNAEIFYKDQFYWDSYFTILGLVDDEKTKLARGMVENFVHLYKRFGIIPMRNRYYNLGTSQIPFLTSMITEVYEREKDTGWLKKVVPVAESELNNYWMNEHLTERHIVYKGLSRYCDHYITHLGAEHESGWDMTSRFNDHCLDYLPVDLNSCLYKYEMDLFRYFSLLKKHKKAERYLILARKRKKQMIRLMWNSNRSFFFDYDKTKKEQSGFYSVAGFYPLWARLATEKQAEQICEKALPLFECKGGIANTLSTNLSSVFKQHDYPNGWPHQQWIVIRGLLNYGYRVDAERIATKWLDMNQKVFRKTGKLWEKYDVVKQNVGLYNADRYPTQSGFSWTNAVFLRLVKQFDK